MLKSIVINTTLGHGEVRKEMTRDKPQSGVISRMLWNLVINGILLDLKRVVNKVVGI